MAVTILPFGTATARAYGWSRAQLEGTGQSLTEADLQIATAACCHGLSLVTGNTSHYERVHGLRLCRVLEPARAGG